MIEFHQLAESGEPATTLTLPFHARERCRQKVTLDDGRAAGLFLPRGTVLQPEDRLRSPDGLVVVVRAAAETVSETHSSDSLLLTRAAYHLGNRHVALQIGPGRLRWLHDHVLDDMIRGLGLPVAVQEAPFLPEPGAYAQGHGHSHAH